MHKLGQQADLARHSYTLHSLVLCVATWVEPGDKAMPRVDLHTLQLVTVCPTMLLSESFESRYTL